MAIQEIAALREAVEAPLRGRVLRTRSSGTPDLVRGVSSYRIEVLIPKGVQPRLALGQSVRVTLPTIHHSEVRARVERIAAEKVELFLADQVQELADREVRVHIPLQSKGIFRIPFTSILSPRGLTKEVFLLKGDRVEKVAVEVVGSGSAQELWVVGQFTQGDRVVTHGLDNLVSGDRVQVVAGERGLQ